VTLTAGGSGYARLGRIAPTITPSVSGGTGATFTVALDELSEFLGNTPENCMEVPYWSVESVAVTAGGSGYSDGVAVTFSAASGDTTVSSAQGRAYVEIVEPENETFSIAGGGTGAVLAAVWDELASNEWAFTRTDNPCPAPAKRSYRLSDITITAGGSGYSQHDRITISFPTAADGVVVTQAYIDVESVDGNGAITGIFISPDNNQFVPGPAGKYAGAETDELAEIVVNSCANQVGHYYREDAGEPPYVAVVTVTVSQESPSNGSGASVTATVEDDTASADFGKVVLLTLQDGGTGYLQPASACSDLDTLYIEWGNLSTSVNWRTHIGGVGNICGFDFRENDGDIDGPEGPYCRTGLDSVLSDAGNTTDFQFVSSFTTPECKCGGYLHMTFTLQFWCRECYAVSGPQVVVQTNKIRYRTLCVRFAADEDGCPVGDAEIVGWSVGELGTVLDGCQPYTKHDDTFVSNDPCNCPTGCDVDEEPQISFMP
jgi:hypothetical protein